jgi:nucleoside-diphosphate-sugar epimerase
MSSLEGRKVLITGATGFIGANLVRRAIGAGADVSIFTRMSSDTWRINDKLECVSLHKVDLLDYEKLMLTIRDIDPEIIYHTAAYGGNPAQKDFKKIITSNYIATVNLVNACKKSNFELFVNTGSSSEYGIKTLPMSEEDLLEPMNDYGVAKSAATVYCRFAAKSERLPIVTLRLFSPYGSYEGSTRLIPSAILDCLHGKNPMITSLAFVRDFLFIEDIMVAYLKALDAKDLEGEIINIGSGHQHSIGDVVQEIIKLTGNNVVPEIGGSMRWSNEPAKWEADISKAKRLLNWEPKYDLTLGLRATIKWFEENLFLYE